MPTIVENITPTSWLRLTTPPPSPPPIGELCAAWEAFQTEEDLTHRPATKGGTPAA